MELAKTPGVNFSRIPLKIGNELPFPVYTDRGHVLLNRGELIDSPETFRRLRIEGRVSEKDVRDWEAERMRNGAYVQSIFTNYIDLNEHPNYVANFMGRVNERATFHMSQGLQELHMEWERQIKELPPSPQYEPRLSPPVNGVEFFTATAKSLDKIGQSDSDQALGIMQLWAIQPNRSYRALHTALLVHRLATIEGHSEEQRISWMAAALTADLAMPAIYNRDWVRQHPKVAYDHLKEWGVQDQDWLNAVLDHHERWEGDGYPFGKKGEAISQGGMILGAADRFAAMVRPREDRDSFTIPMLWRHFIVEKASGVDPGLTSRLSRSLGVYIPGSLWKLSTGEVGIVVARTQEAAKPN